MEIKWQSTLENTEVKLGTEAVAEITIPISKPKYHALIKSDDFHAFCLPYLGLKKSEKISCEIKGDIKYETEKHTISNTPSLLQWFVGKEDLDYLCHNTVNLKDETNKYKIQSPVMEDYISVHGKHVCTAIDDNSCKLTMTTLVHVNVWGGGMIESVVVGRLKTALDIWPQLLKEWENHKTGLPTGDKN